MVGQIIYGMPGEGDKPQIMKTIFWWSEYEIW